MLWVVRQYKKVDGLLNFGSYLAWIFGALGLSGAVLMAWLSTEWQFFWTTLGWFGVAGVALLTWFMIGLGLNLYRWTQPQRVEVGKTHSTRRGWIRR